MKGNPILRLILVLFLLAAVLIPVCQLALNEPQPAVTTASEKAESASALLDGRLLLHTAPAPLRCAVTLRGKTLLKEKNLLSPGEYAVGAQVASGDDLVITAEWSDDNPHAAQAEFLPPGMTSPVKRTFWAKRSLEDVLTIPVNPATQSTADR
jgi:hypothetical protein